MNRKIERTPEENAKIEKIAEHYKAILELIGEDTQREGLLKTPRRAAKALVDITQGYTDSAENIIKSAIFEHGGSQMVVVKDIEFYSLCEHHILPFFGKVSIGYIPDGEMVGLSKLARVVEVYARRLQVQEHLTKDICEAVFRNLRTKGVIVICEAAHMCMQMRGIEKQNSVTTTIDYRGDFENPTLREEFMRLVDNRRN
ncbi:MAG: GTP cyclohydrolase I FolE [Muribaculaceae bacterium]|nr:GTP cyclohydrolase I FolE [Muribaculaceae bacterium]